MQILTQIFAPYTLPLNEGGLRRGTLSKTPTFSINPSKKSWSRGVAFLVDWGGNFCHRAKKDKRIVFSAVEEGSLAPGVQRKRKVVEHICLFKAKEDLSEEQEKDMLDYLYTTQYHMRGIVALSLGRISEPNTEQYTHAIFMRFQTKEDLAKFYENPFYLGVLKEHVMPYCHGFFYLDYESEVEDDILPIFRKGEEFNYGVELVLLIAFSRNSLGGPAEDAMTSLEFLTMEFPSLIVQATKGANLNMTNMEYTHGVVIRFRSYVEIKIPALHPKGSVSAFFGRSYWHGAYVARRRRCILDGAWVVELRKQSSSWKSLIPLSSVPLIVCKTATSPP